MTDATRQSGLSALAGTTNFGTIITDLDSKDHATREKATLAYNVYLDRLMGYLSQYLCKLLADIPLDQIDGIVFSGTSRSSESLAPIHETGGIGEKASRLRHDVLSRFSWIGCAVNQRRNEHSDGSVREITADGSKLRGWVVETDEEGWCAHLAREEFGF